MNKKPNKKDDSLTLEVLGAVETKENLTQRHLATRMGVALGLANSYLKRCINKGLVKVKQVPANRYLYYLTPKGFVEKSRLTAEYLSASFSFFRQASESCEECFHFCIKNGWKKIILAGDSELAEIASLKSVDLNVNILAILDADSKKNKLSGIPVYTQIADLPEFDVVMVTDFSNTKETYFFFAEQFGEDRVLVPGLLKKYVKINKSES